MFPIGQIHSHNHPSQCLPHPRFFNDWWSTFRLGTFHFFCAFELLHPRSSRAVVTGVLLASLQSRHLAYRFAVNNNLDNFITASFSSSEHSRPCLTRKSVLRWPALCWMSAECMFRKEVFLDSANEETFSNETLWIFGGSSLCRLLRLLDFILLLLLVILSDAYKRCANQWGCEMRRIFVVFSSFVFFREEHVQQKNKNPPSVLK